MILIYTDRSVVKQIRTLPKVHIVTFQNGEISTKGYYTFPRRDTTVDLKNYINTFVKLWHKIILKFDLDSDKKLYSGIFGLSLYES